MTVFMEGLEPAEVGLQEYTLQLKGCHALRIWHAASSQPGCMVPTVMDLAYWEIDGEKCDVDPPKLSFDDIPEELSSIQARFFSSNPGGVEGHAIFYPDSQVVCDFAYKGNVNIDAWFDVPYEVLHSGTLSNE